ncbi:MAG TPA: hypothetical protein PLP49_05075 [Anaerohalosphaeraceae bacterium]|nr:hypothetical protein [Anaerohalosphaeraceae bacterium]
MGLTGSQHGQLKPLAGSGRSASNADTATCLENRNGNDLENSAGVVFRVLWNALCPLIFLWRLCWKRTDEYPVV